ncbi:MAG: hypothetical protein KatS3mg032_1312 [Cyclobacteriaceae bacterium]|nr:MAG: hypothetical protein KatS3mg032_1312 [Cyclobacteriaceae bacterium]
MSLPGVSVICLSYNHARFVEEAVQSVLNQDYPNVEIWIADDASTDNSLQVIERLTQQHPHIHFMHNDANQGHCRTFNKVLGKTNGEFIIDLSADDVLLPVRISRGVKELQLMGSTYGVHFSDARYIDEAGRALYLHSQRYPHETIPQGNVYIELIKRYFICPPTLMFRREVLEQLGGYDEQLHYEDFDILVRAARHFCFSYSPEVLVKRRVVKGAGSSRQFRLFSRHSLTTLAVCKKIMAMNRTEPERRALQKRLRYEMMLNLKLLNVDVAWQFMEMLIQNGKRLKPDTALNLL